MLTCALGEVNTWRAWGKAVVALQNNEIQRPYLCIDHTLGFGVVLTQASRPRINSKPRIYPHPSPIPRSQVQFQKIKNCNCTSNLCILPTPTWSSLLAVVLTPAAVMSAALVTFQ
eukprot:1780469-Amphidinium_carterae.1